MLKISEVSKETGLSVATIRYYSDLGMVPSVKRNYMDQRLFDDESITWLMGIKFLRDIDIPISEIELYIKLCQKTGPKALEQRHDLLLKQKIKAQQMVSNAQDNLDRLNKKITLENEIIKGRKRDSLSAARRFTY